MISPDEVGRQEEGDEEEYPGIAAPAWPEAGWSARLLSGWRFAYRVDRLLSDDISNWGTATEDGGRLSSAPGETRVRGDRDDVL